MDEFSKYVSIMLVERFGLSVLMGQDSTQEIKSLRNRLCHGRWAYTFRCLETRSTTESRNMIGAMSAMVHNACKSFGSVRQSVSAERREDSGIAMSKEHRKACTLRVQDHLTTLCDIPRFYLNGSC